MCLSSIFEFIAGLDAFHEKAKLSVKDAPRRWPCVANDSCFARLGHDKFKHIELSMKRKPYGSMTYSQPREGIPDTQALLRGS
jgi:hypothetical protein